ncbi:MAG: GIY-YIG nuclease family protein [archaeon]
MKQKKHYVYLIECADTTYYCGSSKDVQKRFEAHSKKRGAKYTKYRLPLKLVYVEECCSLKEAMRREIAIKRMKRKQKELLVASGKT